MLQKPSTVTSSGQGTGRGPPRPADSPKGLIIHYFRGHCRCRHHIPDLSTRVTQYHMLLTPQDAAVRARALASLDHVPRSLGCCQGSVCPGGWPESRGIPWDPDGRGRREGREQRRKRTERTRIASASPRILCGARRFNEPPEPRKGLRCAPPSPGSTLGHAVAFLGPELAFRSPFSPPLICLATSLHPKDTPARVARGV